MLQTQQPVRLLESMFHVEHNLKAHVTDDNHKLHIIVKKAYMKLIFLAWFTREAWFPAAIAVIPYKSCGPWCKRTGQSQVTSFAVGCCYYGCHLLCKGLEMCFHWPLTLREHCLKLTRTPEKHPFSEVLSWTRLHIWNCFFFLGQGVNMSQVTSQSAAQCLRWFFGIWTPAIWRDLNQSVNEGLYLC